MKGQKNDSTAEQVRGTAAPEPVRVDSPRPHLVIPCWVAPQHCPTPFHQAVRSITRNNRLVGDTKTSQTRTTGSGQRRNPQNRSKCHLSEGNQAEITDRNPTIHWLVATTPQWPELTHP